MARRWECKRNNDGHSGLRNTRNGRTVLRRLLQQFRQPLDYGNGLFSRFGKLERQVIRFLSRESQRTEGKRTLKPRSLIAWGEQIIRTEKQDGHPLKHTGFYHVKSNRSTRVRSNHVVRQDPKIDHKLTMIVLLDSVFVDEQLDCEVSEGTVHYLTPCLLEHSLQQQQECNNNTRKPGFWFWDHGAIEFECGYHQEHENRNVITSFRHQNGLTVRTAVPNVFKASSTGTTFFR